MLPDNIFLASLIIFSLRVLDVGLGTIRTVFILQGRKVIAASIGFFEVMIFIFAISQVITGIGQNWVYMVAYAAGFSSGTFLGLWLEGKFAMGYTQLRVISRGQGESIIQALWHENVGATLVEGNGRRGPVDMVFSIVPRKDIKRLVSLATQIDDDCFISLSDSRYMFRGYVGGTGKRK
jgi:uncharacterized protein YebE (UPF0316 family)